MTKVVIFNAPPDAGKDIAVKYCKRILNADGKFNIATHAEFKGQLFKLTKLVFGISDDKWDSWYTREGKEIKRVELGNRSCRESLIFVSEVMIKPNLGGQYFGEYAAKYDTPVVLFSDGGFISELDPLIKKHGFENICVVRIHRKGRDFGNDSRAYLPDGCVGTMFDLENFMPDTDNDSEYCQFINRAWCCVDNFLKLREKHDQACPSK